MVRRTSLLPFARLTIAAIGVLVLAGAFTAAKAEDATVSDAQVEQTAKDVFAGQDFWWKRTKQVESPSFVGRIVDAIYDAVIKPILDWLFDAIKSVFRAILNWLARLFGMSLASGDWSGGVPFLWFAIVILTGVVVWWAVKFIRNRNVVVTRPTRTRAPEQLATAMQLLADAEAAIAAGDHREAIRLAFLAVIAHFQDAGKLSADRTRSNREYLRELTPWPDLSAIFRKCADPFERCWYGGRPLDGLEVESVISECRGLAAAGGR